MKYKFRKCFILSVVIIIFTACTPSVDPKIDMKPPTYVEQLPAKESGSGISNAGSLYGRGENPLFSDRKAMNVNDIVTIVISEMASQSSSGSKKTARDTTTQLKGGIITSGSPLSSATNQINKFGNIGFEAGGENEFSGSGSTSRNERFTTTISARIIKILNNGNYFIEGNRELLINGEKQIIQVTGVIRPSDISQNNQIDSKYIADAKILYKTEGELDKSTKKPWGTRLIETIWPF